MALKYYESPFHATESPEEANASVLKTKLAIMIRDYVEQAKLTQEDAAQILGTTQSRLSPIVNGKLQSVTLDFLFDMLSRIGYKAQFTFNSNNEYTIKLQKKSAA